MLRTYIPRHTSSTRHGFISEQNLRRSVDLINQVLAGTKKLDLFECARVDPTVPIEEAMKNLSILQKEGKFDHIGISEVSAATLRRANSVGLEDQVDYRPNLTILSVGCAYCCC